MKVGVVVDGGTYWLGGVNYFRNLFTAVHRLPNAAIEPVIFTGSRGRSAFAGFPPFKVVQSEIINARSLPWFLRKGIQLVSSRDRLFERLLHRHGVSALSHSGYLGTGSPIASIGWIPDFQHLHLPEFFSKEEQLQRNRIFMELCKKCDRVIVSSECAKADLRSFAPQYAHKAAVLKFVASPESAAGLPTLQQLQQQYAFHGQYFLLPNHFWAHKNHRVVITALKLLKQQGKRVFVLATGSTNDDLRPGFFDALMEYARECDVLDSFRVLGVVPFADLAGLMQYAVAFINPSRFEGWSTTVEESKSLGKRILLSDIPVHREQSPELSLYFQPDDPEALAAALLTTWESFDLQTDAEMQAYARKSLPARREKFAATYQSILLDTVGNHH
jgi:glycosyltransferase involved in cell wall biosynthesis